MYLVKTPTAAHLKAYGLHLLDFLFPPVCLNCAAAVATPDTLCAECFTGMRPITAPMCQVLGLPFATDPGDGVRSLEAIADPPPFERARSAYVYNDVARALVTRFKYRDHPELARFAARAMRVAGTAILQGGPVLVPVPLHRTRAWQRRYNQSLELARELARLTGLHLEPALVRRTRATRRQVGLDAAGRARNVAGAFAAAPFCLERLAGRPVVIIDDVITTGATVRAVTHALKKAGVNQIDVMSFARVVSDEAVPT